MSEKNKMKAICLIKDNVKIFRSAIYNYNFDMRTGYFERWGKTKEDDPQRSPFGPELMDIELSTVCHGIPKKGADKPIVCAHCYKQNTPIGKNMSLSTFKEIFKKFPPTLTQIAFGLGDINGNPDFYKILAYCRRNKVIGNLTTNGYGLDDKTVRKLVFLAGSTAISVYQHNKDVCYDAVKRLLDANKKFNKNLQVNIHCLLSKETLDFCYEVAIDSKTDPRLEGLGAIVFLFLKKVGRGETYHYVSSQEYSDLLSFLLKNEIRFGHDSCAYPNMISHAKESQIKKDDLRVVSEGCESSRMSLYIAVDGIAYSCSFAEKKMDGVDVLKAEDFLRDVWNNERLSSFRKKLISGTSDCKCEEKNKSCFRCPIYPGVTLCSNKGGNDVLSKMQE